MLQLLILQDMIKKKTAHVLCNTKAVLSKTAATYSPTLWAVPSA